MANSATGRRLGAKLSAIWKSNPVLVKGMGLIPAIAVSTSLKNALALSVMMALTVIPTYIAASLLKLKSPFYVRIPAWALISSAFYIPAILAVNALFPLVLMENVGIYLYIFVVDVIVVFRADSFARVNHVVTALTDAFVNSVSFTAVICIVGLVRELMTSSSIYGAPVPLMANFRIRGAMPPFFGFLLLGLFAAFMRSLNSAFRRKRAESGAADDTPSA
ncbi:MAG: hypothetical protein LBC56_03655 [Oscillospiraceae bacterium]|jgi:Na+-translocating ferredoxin:NAD+ oxidoreductase RnfE subunit|nr:hypothetical protein [Oscillospiraceae bacterium]